jgi:hypothetical protein
MTWARGGIRKNKQKKMNKVERVIGNGQKAYEGPVCVDDAHRDWKDMKREQKTQKTGKSTGVRKYAHRVRKLRKKGTPWSNLIMQCAGTAKSLKFLGDLECLQFILVILGQRKGVQLVGAQFRIPCAATTEGTHLRPG